MPRLTPAPKPEYRVDEPFHTLVFDPLGDGTSGPYDVFVWVPNPRGEGWMGPPMAIWRFREVPAGEPLTVRLDMSRFDSKSCKLWVGGERWRSVECSIREDYRIWPRQSVGVSLVGEEGQVFTTNRLDLVISHPDVLARHYSRHQHATSYTPEPDHFGEAFHRARLRQARRLIGPLLGPGKQVLEAGSGYSLLRMALDDGGFPGRLVACDWDQEAMLYMSKQCPHIDWLVSGVERLPFKNEAFDVLHVGEVIEHVIDPQAALQEWRRVIRPRGHIVVTTPNRKHRMARLTGVEAPENLEHLREYTVGELKEALARAGFRVVRVEGLYLAALAVRLPGQPWTDLLRSKAGFRGKGRLLEMAMEAGRFLPSHAYNICVVAKKDGQGSWN